VAGDLLGAGWFQIEDPKQTGYWVKPGFSGAPIWDSEQWNVLGIVVAAETEPNRRVAFVASATYLVAWAATAVSDPQVARLASSYEKDKLDAVKQLKREQLGKSNLVFTSGSLRSLADYLEPGELCAELAEVAITGVIGTNLFTGLLAATDRRIILVYKFPTAPAIVKVYPYSLIKRIEWGFKHFGSSSTVRIEAGHRRRLSVTEFDVPRMTALVNYATARLADYRRADASS
jgi:hypothetical protein